MFNLGGMGRRYDADGVAFDGAGCPNGSDRCLALFCSGIHCADSRHCQGALPTVLRATSIFHRGHPTRNVEPDRLHRYHDQQLAKWAMRYLWYIAQTLFIGWFTWAVLQRHPEMTAGELSIQLFISICLCAFLTACLTRLWDWLTVRRQPAPVARAPEDEVLPPAPSHRLPPLSRADGTLEARPDR